jgi:hypothetical protein
MSVQVRNAIQKNLQVIRAQLADSGSSDRTAIMAEIKELETSRNSIKHDTAKKAIQKEIDSLSYKLDQKSEPKPHQSPAAVSRLKSLADLFEKSLEMMGSGDIPWYMESTRGRKAGTKNAKKK